VSKSADVFIIGAGITGLACAMASGRRVFESLDQPGGICSSYYVRPGDGRRLHQPPDDDEVYRFELGGGHWIHSGDPVVLHLINSLAPLKQYRRIASIYFSKHDHYVPYPIQNHLAHLGKDLAARALAEMMSAPRGHPPTMADWLEQSFGKTLTELFFAPFHELYTAGLWTRIGPQDAYKSPVDMSAAIRGAFETTAPAGYNTTFAYPRHGLNHLIQRMQEQCQIGYGKHVTHIDTRRKEISFADGVVVGFRSLISTVPLNQIMTMTGLPVDDEPDPWTSVLVLNIGAQRGERCPNDHWLYIPDSGCGFHRVGFYSNVDVSFLPRSARQDSSKVGIYVERAYPGGSRPDDSEIHDYSQAVVKKLQEWQYIGDTEVVDATWIDVAYTWSWPGSHWKAEALRVLGEHDIHQVGRYGRWGASQSIAESMRDGLMVGGAARLL